ncbi:hypothetical protein B0H13DRAFT_2234771 [Mycena leptocephala]|nr:hypothetical protein B0H13DRAFT_2234771 [Mycena leptocephala]
MDDGQQYDRPSTTPEAVGELKVGEPWWRDLQPSLKQCGYTLRPRYRPGWFPSWKAAGATIVNRFQIIDAIRDADGLVVHSRKSIKGINRFLTSPDSKLSIDPKNHCAPLLDILHLPGQPEYIILVMKLLRSYGDPDFDTSGKCFTVDIKHYAKHLTRRPPKYSFIDFEIDATVPEYQNDRFRSLDPFRTDIYFLGNLIREDFLDYLLADGRVGFEFMRPLITDMVNIDPQKRPTMDEVVPRFERTRSG